jgi:hypothetical protein
MHDAWLQVNEPGSGLDQLKWRAKRTGNSPYSYVTRVMS